MSNNKRPLGGLESKASNTVIAVSAYINDSKQISSIKGSAIKKILHIGRFEEAISEIWT